MKNMMLSLAAALLLGALAPADAWANPQHERMKRCSQEAKEKTLKGEERKQFMSTCLKGKHTPSPAATTASAREKAKGDTPTQVAPVADSGALSPVPQDRMKECNRAATEKTLKGAERKNFISECLKG